MMRFFGASLSDLRFHGRGIQIITETGHQLAEVALKTLTPDAIAAPFGKYAHGISLPSDWQVTVTSGQLPLARDGSVPEGAFAQAQLCFENCEAILAEALMGPKDVIRVAAYVTDRAHMQAYMKARDDWLGPHNVLPASTLLIVSGFTRPEFLVEVEVTAAQAPSE